MMNLMATSRLQIGGAEAGAIGEMGKAVGAVMQVRDLLLAACLRLATCCLLRVSLALTCC